MKRKTIFLFSLTIAIVPFWAFIGVERLVGDHEIGTVWEPFLKHRPSLQLRFSDPSRQGLEKVPFEELDRREQMRFIEFCTIRYGEENPAKCHSKIAARKV